MVTPATINTIGGHNVLLNLSSRSKYSDTSGWLVNRIPLKADNVSISTTKNVLATPLPLSGLVTGESESVALDFGIAQKAISISGIITGETVYKKFKDGDTGTLTNPALDGDDVLAVNMTAHEIGQLIHSYVDSSFVQKQQNISSLILLIPSRVNKDYQYHNATAGTDDVENLPLVPFTYKTRGGGAVGDLLPRSTTLDADPVQTGNYPDAVTTSKIETALEGFVRSFSTNIIAGTPYIEFNLDFEVARNPLG